jgi:hypothetical protein
MHTNDLFKRSFSLLSATVALMKKTLYKTIEYQLIFKVFYITVLLYIINASIDLFLSLFDLISNGTSTNVPIVAGVLGSVFDIHLILAFILSLFAIVVVYTIEKNGIIIITGDFYRGIPTSFFNTLLRAVKYAPRFIATRASDLMVHILICAVLYIYWRIASSILAHDLISLVLASLLILYSSWLFIAILFSYTRTGFTIHLFPAEPANNNFGSLGMHMWPIRIIATVIFYFILLCASILIIIVLAFILRSIFSLTLEYDMLFSISISFFMAFCIVSIIIALSLLKNFRACILTILYFDMRRRQKLPLSMNILKKMPRVSRDMRFATVMIFFIIFGASTILSVLIHHKTNAFINNMDQFVSEDTTIPSADLFTVAKPDPHKIAERAVLNRQTILQTIEKIVMRFIVFVTSK